MRRLLWALAATIGSAVLALRAQPELFLFFLRDGPWAYAVFITGSLGAFWLQSRLLNRAGPTASILLGFALHAYVYLLATTTGANPPWQVQYHDALPWVVVYGLPGLLFAAFAPAAFRHAWAGPSTEPNERRNTGSEQGAVRPWWLRDALRASTVAVPAILGAVLLSSDATLRLGRDAWAAPVAFVLVLGGVFTGQFVLLRRGAWQWAIAVGFVGTYLAVGAAVVAWFLSRTVVGGAPTPYLQVTAGQTMEAVLAATPFVALAPSLLWLSTRPHGASEGETTDPAPSPPP